MNGLYGTLAAAATLVAVIAGVACLKPGWTASGVDPNTVLRPE